MARDQRGRGPGSGMGRPFNPSGPSSFGGARRPMRGGKLLLIVGDVFSQFE